MFGDSSHVVFTAIAFLRGKKTTHKCSFTELDLVFRKVKVAPMKAITIPKLELQASLAQFRRDVSNSLTMKIDKTFMWNDSTLVLHWLHSLEKQHVFVANQVTEVLDFRTVDEWNYVKSSNNPADSLTRGIHSKSLCVSSWLIGCSFLKTYDRPFEPSTDDNFKVKTKMPDLCQRDHTTI